MPRGRDILLKPKGRALGFTVALSLSFGSFAQANGLGENRSWQFDTTVDKANKAAVLDVVERKRGGFYDGFDTYTYNTTTIGTQINCNQSATSLGNEAANGMDSNSASLGSTSDVFSSGSGNDLVDNQDSSGLASGTTTGTNNQTNDGAVTSDVSGNSTSTSGSINTGATDQVLNNTQDNTNGTQTSDLTSSTACDIGNGAVLSGDGSFLIGDGTATETSYNGVVN